MHLYTVGHSTRSADAFLGLIARHGVRRVADIRRVPRSRRFPQFNTDALAALLRERGIGYRHFPGLGGWRRPRRDSPNTAWRQPGFRGYADYMLEAEFALALEELVDFARDEPTALM